MLTPSGRTRPSPPSRLRVALVTSTRAPGLDRLLETARRPGPAPWELVACVASDPACAERSRLERAGVPAVVHDIRAFYAARGAKLGDLSVRPAYDTVTARLLAAARPDLVLLAGYLHVVTAPLLEAYPARIANVHDADLTLTAPGGGPRYPGLHATRDAIFAGEPETRSTAHLVSPAVDGGPALVRSWAFPVHPLVADARAWHAVDILKAYAYAQREWMMRAAWGILLERTIALFAGDAVRLLDGRAVVQGALGPLDLAAPGSGAAARAAIAAVPGR